MVQEPYLSTYFIPYKGVPRSTILPLCLYIGVHDSTLIPDLNTIDT